VIQRFLARATRALGGRTTRATVEDALRRATEQAEGEQAPRAADQLRYLERLPSRIDLDVLGSVHRTPIPDLLIAETALHNGLGVVHVDRAYERIAEVRPLTVRRLR
jgi:predicted nucleic acid-binding protein